MYKSKVLLLFLFLYVQDFNLFAQKGKIDSLQTLLATTTNDSIKTAIYVELCWLHRNINANKAEQFCKEAEAIAQKRAYHYLLAKTWNHLGLISNNRAFYAEALVFYFQVVDIATKKEYNDQLGYAYQSIANIYIRNDNKQRDAIDFINKSFQVFQKVNNLDGFAYSYLILGRFYGRKQAFDSAIVNYGKALRIWENLQNENSIANIYYEMGVLFKKQKQYDKAHLHFDRAYFIFNRLNNTRGKILIINEFADIDLQNNKLDSALMQVNDALALTQSSGITELVEIAYKQLITIYEAKRNYQQAHRYEKLLNHYKDSISNVEENRYALEIETKYILDKKNEDIKRLEEQNQRKQNALYLLIIVLLAMLAIGLLLYFNIKQKQKTNQQLLFQQAQIKTQNNQLSQLNEEINLQKEEQEKLNIFKNRLFSIISHDLRNPIASLKGALFLFKSDFLTAQDRSDLVDKLSHDLQASSYLLDNMLNWTKAQMEGLKINPVSFSAYAIVIENFELLKPQATQKQITMECNIASDTMIYADLEMIKTVIRNLLHNAIKYSFPKGKIQVFTATTNEYTELSVQDYGQGINNDAKQKLFGSDHFSTFGTANEKGSGLGLLLSKDFVEKNGGSIWVESVENEGSIFTIKLPNTL